VTFRFTDHLGPDGAFKGLHTVTTVRKLPDGSWGYSCIWEGCSDLLSGGWESQETAFILAEVHAKEHIRKIPMTYQSVRLKDG
jgi:hypothetical protein